MKRICVLFLFFIFPLYPQAPQEEIVRENIDSYLTLGYHQWSKMQQDEKEMFILGYILGLNSADIYVRNLARRGLFGEDSLSQLTDLQYTIEDIIIRVNEFYSPHYNQVEPIWRAVLSVFEDLSYQKALRERR